MRIQEQKPQLKINNFIPGSKVLDSVPSMKIKSFTPNAGMEKSISTSLTTVSTILQGSPIGLLLALTYANNIITSTTTYSGGLSPNAKIITT